ncbi:MAG: Eco57I restriction-modification methylase domain-containing protein [Candidatus Hodarchaeota archaeon]
MKLFIRKYSFLSEEIINYMREKGLNNDISKEFTQYLLKQSLLYTFFKIIKYQVIPSNLSIEDYKLFFYRLNNDSSQNENKSFTKLVDVLLPFNWSLSDFLEHTDKVFILEKLKGFIDSFTWKIVQTSNITSPEGTITPQIFEKVFDLENSNSRGVVHTPYILAYWMIESIFKKYIADNFKIPNFSLDMVVTLNSEKKILLKEWLMKIRVLDIAVGCGTYFLAAGNYLTKLLEGLGLSPIYLEKILFGVDVNIKAIQICKIRFALFILNLKPSMSVEELIKIIENSKLKAGNSLIGYVKDPIHENSLNNLDKISEEATKNPSIQNKCKVFHWFLKFPEIFQRNKNGGFDFVIGNPPFIGYRYISREEKKILKFLYPSIYTGLNDLYYFFLLRAMELLNSNGFLALIVSRYFLEARYAAKLRSDLFKNAKIEAIIDFREYKVFPGFGINTAIIFATNKYDSSSLSHMFVLRNYNITLFSLLQELENCLENPDKISKIIFQGFQFNQTDQTNGTSNIVSERVKVFLSRMTSQSNPLNEICDIGTGFHSGNDVVFSKNIIEEEGEFFGEIRDIMTRMPLEEDLVKEIIKTSDILPFIINWSKKYVILTQRGVKIDSYPLTKRYLIQFKEKLINRYEVKKRIAKWYEIAQVRNQFLFEAKKKIVCPYRTKSPRFAIDDNQRYTSIDCTSILLKKNSTFNIYYILGLLNSELIEFYLYAMAKKLDARKIELYPKTLSDIPIKIPKTDYGISLRDEIADLTEKIFVSLKSKRFTNGQKQEMINSGKKGIVKFGKDMEYLTEQISSLDLLVYNLYGLESHINEIQEEIKHLKS